MKILRPNTNFNIILNYDNEHKTDSGWDESFNEFEQQVLEQIINPIENYETIRYIHEPYTSTTENVTLSQTDIWFYFYFLSGATYLQNYSPTGLSNKENASLLRTSTESFFRLEFFKTPSNESPNRNNRRLVAVKTLKIPLGEKYFLTSNGFNDFVHIPVFTGSNYKNKENMYFFWFQDDSVLDETSISGDTFYLSAKYFNSVDGTIIDFTNSCLGTTDEIVEEDDLYYKLTIDKTNYSYKLFEFTNGVSGNRVGIRSNPIKFFEKGGGDCARLLITPTPTPSLSPTPSITPSSLSDNEPTPTPTPSASRFSSPPTVYQYNLSSTYFAVADDACNYGVDLDTIVYSFLDFGCGSYSPYAGRTLYTDSNCTIPYYGSGLYHRISKVGCAGVGSIVKINTAGNIVEGCFCQGINDSTCYVDPPPQPNQFLLCYSDVDGDTACNAFQNISQNNCRYYYTSPYDTEITNGVIIYDVYPTVVAADGYYSNSENSWSVFGFNGALYNQSKCIGGGFFPSLSVTPTPTLTPTPSLTRPILSEESMNVFTEIPISYADFMAPSRGLERWINLNWGTFWGPKLYYIDLTNPDAPPQLKDDTYAMNEFVRYFWSELETDNSTEAFPDYDWYPLESKLQYCAERGKKFSFAFMPMRPGDPNAGAPKWIRDNYSFTPTVDGGRSPNYNSDNVIEGMRRFWQAVADLIEPYKNIIAYIDMNLYGAYGEWHCYGEDWFREEQDALGYTPSNPFGTGKIRTIVDIFCQIFYDYRLVIPILSTMCRSQNYFFDIYDTDAYYILNKKTSKGYLGIRINHLGDNYATYEMNTGPYENGVYGPSNHFTLRTNRWKYSLHCGEPNYKPLPDFPNYSSLTGTTSETYTLHFSSFGHGNYFGNKTQSSNMELAENISNASKYLGYRVVITSGTCQTNVTLGLPFTISLGWKNVGNAPVYEKWEVWYELRKVSSPNIVVWSHKTSMYKFMGNDDSNPVGIGENTLLLPYNLMGEYVHIESMTITGVVAGQYNLCLVIKDYDQYMEPLPLAIYGRVAGDYPIGGYYILKTINVT